MRTRSALPSIALAVAVLSITFLAAAAPAGAAWIRDQNANGVDDVIDAVNTQGLTAAYENGNLNARKLIFVHPEDTPFTFGVYIAFDHKPTDADAAAATAAGAQVTWRPRYIDYIRARASYAEITALASLPGVTHVEADPVLYPFNDVASRTLRGRAAAGGAGTATGLFPSVWQNLGITGKGVVVAIIDSGVNDQPNGSYPGHESLRGKFAGGGDFSNEDASLNTPPDSSENPFNQDAEGTFHGTHVAGTAIGSGGPDGILGGATPGLYAGIAPEARLADCKALSDAGVGGGANPALEWCIAHMETTWTVESPDAVYKGVQIANMSLGGLLGGTNGTDAGAQMVNAAVRAGIVVCVSTGNDGTTGDIGTPASADMALAVGAFEDRNTVQRGDDIVGDYSNEGPRLDDGDSDHFDEMSPSVLGTGSDVLSALGDPLTAGDEYHNINGTSMSCPSVAGLCALVKQANPNGSVYLPQGSRPFCR